MKVKLELNFTFSNYNPNLSFLWLFLRQFRNFCTGKLPRPAPFLRKPGREVA